jgi:hypothetical protein
MQHSIFGARDVVPGFKARHADLKVGATSCVIFDALHQFILANKPAVQTKSPQ